MNIHFICGHRCLHRCLGIQECCMHVDIKIPQDERRLWKIRYSIKKKSQKERR